MAKSKKGEYLPIDFLPSAPDLNFEQALWKAGVRFVGGIDEAGRGALAGPVAAAVVVFPKDSSLLNALHGVRDSKQMTPAQRQHWSVLIRQSAVSWGTGLASHQEIDALGILPATRLAALRAVQSLDLLPEHLLLDNLFLPEEPIPQAALIKGDCRSLSVAAASVLAKVTRDDLMRQFEVQFPGYGFAVHKGYGTAAHCRAIQELGISPLHRRTFQPVKAMLLSMAPQPA